MIISQQDKRTALISAEIATLFHENGIPWNRDTALALLMTGAAILLDEAERAGEKAQPFSVFSECALLAQKIHDTEIPK